MNAELHGDSPFPRMGNHMRRRAMLPEPGEAEQLKTAGAVQ
jgi:hypothetical protein